MFNPAKAADEIKKEYIGYITTSLHFRNQDLQRKLLESLNETVSQGPFVEIKDSFKSGKTIDDLIADGLLSPLFRKIEQGKRHKPKLLLTRPLYLHQERAVEKVVAGRNIVVSTGTGSGKTHCFMIPVLNELLREKEAGTLNDGLRAIFIYPMNALANDQIKGLREILMSYPDIRFGVYNGGTENKEPDAIRLYEAMYANESYPELRQRLPNEELSRDEMKRRPPHILFTNYAMLEHLLFRPGDDTLFSNSNFKYVVLDEAHVYTGATGIETAFLMRRLKGRVKGRPQFILTSATLGDGSPNSKQQVAEFATRLTGCSFEVDDIISAYRDNPQKSISNQHYPVKLFGDLANEELFFEDVLKDYNLKYVYNKDIEPEILFDIISSSDIYDKLRSIGNLLPLDICASKMGITKDEAVAFISLCARAAKNGKPLIDIRYHYFLKALDGAYMAIDYNDSFSLIRKDNYSTSYGKAAQMFEIAVCEDCGEFAIIGRMENGKLVRANGFNKPNYFQAIIDAEKYESEENNSNDTIYCLCKNCGAIIETDEAHNQWCTCGNTQVLKIKESYGRCLNCNGTLRRFNLGYDAATSVIATSLYEQIPEYKYEATNEESSTNNRFIQSAHRKKCQSKTGSQFLVFSDSRQGAAKFACYLGDAYKEFLRRRGIWNVVASEESRYPNGINFSDFVKLLENYFSSLNIFRNSNVDNSMASPVDNRRNAWVAALNELYNCNRDTSLVSLGKMSFEYIGNTERIIDVMIKQYHLSADDAKNFLDYLAFELVQFKAVRPDNPTDINDSDREYLYFTPIQVMVTGDKIDKFGTKSFLPTKRILKSGDTTYYRTNRLLHTKRILQVDNESAAAFLKEYWGYLISNENPGRLISITGNSQCYYVPAKSFTVHLGHKAVLWRCQKCGKVSQFNIGNRCIQIGCEGTLKPLDSDSICDSNYYAKLYAKGKSSPLFIKEHTAQLAKTNALEYQQLFIRKEINALSCSTTFEMGVDVGGLETVFLRNIPPLASNYAQRVGRAGRSINAAAFAMTFARLSSHDFTFFDHPQEMINGIICPPNFNINNEKILKRHVYAVSLAMFLNYHPELYNNNDAQLFIANKGYEKFKEWLFGKPETLTRLLKASITGVNTELNTKYIDSFDWLDEFCGESGIFTKLINEYESNTAYLKREYNRALKAKDLNTAALFERKMIQYKRNDLIDFLVRGNILPKYGFPIDSVELSQNITSKDSRTINLTRDLSVAIAEYAPSGEVVADGRLYTSRYIRKPFVNKGQKNDFDIAYIAKECPNCNHLNYSTMPIGLDGIPCAICGEILKERDFSQSIEPRSGFITEETDKEVPRHSQERKYKTEAIYIGDKDAYPINKYTYIFGHNRVDVESTANDSLVVKSTNGFYVCPQCGYAIAEDENDKLKEYSDYQPQAKHIRDTTKKHKNPFGKGDCINDKLDYYYLHHEFKTDVAKISFGCNTSDYATMVSVMYAILNAFANKLNIERRDIKACLTYKITNGKTEHKIIIYDSVPGGAGHSRRLITEDGAVLKAVIYNAAKLLETCKCSPSCYRCLRSYENQKIHDILDREKALDFFKRLVETKR